MKIYKPMENASYEIIVINLQVSRATTIAIKNGMHMRGEQYVQSKTWLDSQRGKCCQ